MTNIRLILQKCIRTCHLAQSYFNTYVLIFGREPRSQISGMTVTGHKFQDGYFNRHICELPSSPPHAMLLLHLYTAYEKVVSSVHDDP